MTKYKQKQVDKGVDPWLTNDPWKSSKEEEVGEEDMSIALIPGSFVGETGQPIPILPHLAAEAYGVAVLSVQEAETFAKSEVNMSDDELAAVVIAVEPPVVGSRRCELITFPAFSGDSKILLKGHLVDFGGKPVRLQDTAFSIDIDERQIAVLALEIRREYLQDWQQVAKNPLKHAFAMVDGLQAAVITTWARRFYDGRKMSSADQAATFHAFLNTPQDSLEKILPSSGKGAVLLTPKQGETGAPSGHYRVAWLDTTDLQKAAAIHRVHAELLGLVRGRSFLGLRMRAADYSAVRKKLDPSWNAQGVLTDIPVTKKWVLNPSSC